MEEVKVKQEVIKNEEAINKQKIIEETRIKEHPIHKQPRLDMLWLCGNPTEEVLTKRPCLFFMFIFLCE